jgi:hypothetical protein
MAPTTWSRIEPSAQTTDIEVGLAAGVADPLWLLARQRQLGEFIGDDGGSPIGIHIRASWSALTRFHAGPLPVDAGDQTGRRFDRTRTPLETLIEAEAPRFVHETPAIGWDVRLRAGQRLERELRAAGEDAAAAAIREAFPFAPGTDAAVLGIHDRRYLAVLPGRATDGATAHAALAGGAIPAAVSDVAVDGARLAATIAAWVAWAAPSLAPADGPGPASPAWQPERLEYAFAVAAPGFADGEEVVLEATEYDGSGIEWYSVDVRPGARLGAAADVDDAVGANDPTATRASFTRHVLPQPVTYPGMPADRFWQMEDGRVNLGAMGAGPTDLARMLAVEYAIVYGPDWFLAPLELPVGCLARVDWVVVRDTFGVSVVVGTTGTQRDGAGRQFQPSTTGADVDDNPWLFLPASCGPTLRSTPLERLVVLRDELANLAWGIEHAVLGPAGRPIDQRGPRPAGELPELEQAAALTEEQRAAELVWRLASPAPEGWIPFVAVNRGEPDQPQVRLVRAHLLDTIEATARRTRGQLLAEIGDLYEEEVGRAGLELSLLDQVGRWIDGSTVAWRGREKRPGRGEAESRLFFDRVEDRGPSDA